MSGNCGLMCIMNEIFSWTLDWTWSLLFTCINAVLYKVYELQDKPPEFIIVFLIHEINVLSPFPNGKIKVFVLVSMEVFNIVSTVDNSCNFQFIQQFIRSKKEEIIN